MNISSFSLPHEYNIGYTSKRAYFISTPFPNIINFGYLPLPVARYKEWMFHHSHCHMNTILDTYRGERISSQPRCHILKTSFQYWIRTEESLFHLNPVATSCKLWIPIEPGLKVQRMNLSSLSLPHVFNIGMIHFLITPSSNIKY